MDVSICRYRIDTLMPICWYCIDTLMPICWYCIDTLMPICRYCIDTLMPICWYCNDTLMPICRYWIIMLRSIYLSYKLFPMDIQHKINWNVIFLWIAKVCLFRFPFWVALYSHCSHVNWFNMMFQVIFPCCFVFTLPTGIFNISMEIFNVPFKMFFLFCYILTMFTRVCYIPMCLCKPPLDFDLYSKRSQEYETFSCIDLLQLFKSPYNLSYR